MGYIPSKMVDFNWRENDREVSLSDEVDDMSADEVIDDIREKKTLNLD